MLVWGRSLRKRWKNPLVLLVSAHESLVACVAGKRVKQTRGAGGTQVGAAGLVGEDWWALPFHNPRAICVGRQ